MIVVDASVLIAHLDRHDVHHDLATERLLGVADQHFGANSITLAEVLVGPTRAGRLADAQAALRSLRVTELSLPADAAERLAALRVDTTLKLPDCCVLLAAENAQGAVLTLDRQLAREAARRSSEQVRAAGGVVVRDGRVAVVHRPRYDDWTLPKGKLDVDESFEDAALREVGEETGLRGRLVRELPQVRYEVRGRPKLVRYWLMEVESDGGFVVNDEVDELRWLRPTEALALLSYERDRELLSAAGL